MPRHRHCQREYVTERDRERTPRNMSEVKFVFLPAAASKARGGGEGHVIQGLKLLLPLHLWHRMHVCLTCTCKLCVDASALSFFLDLRVSEVAIAAADAAMADEILMQNFA